MFIIKDLEKKYEKYVGRKKGKNEDNFGSWYLFSKYITVYVFIYFSESSYKSN